MLTARDIMSAPVVTVKKDTSIEELTRLFTEYQINGVPVLDDEDRVVGVVTESDLIEQKKNLHIPTVIALFDAVITLGGEKEIADEVTRLTAAKVEDIFTAKVVAVSPGQSVQEVADLMSEKKLHTIPVIEDGDLVGVIGKIDVIKGFSRG